MSDTYHRTLETPWGEGRILDAGRSPARVRYRLRVAQQMFTGADGGADVVGPRGTTGGIEVVDGGPLEDGREYRLELADGRRMQVLVRRRADFERMYEVSGNEPR
jgi:hypothetical protein